MYNIYDIYIVKKYWYFLWSDTDYYLVFQNYDPDGKRQRMFCNDYHGPLTTTL